MKRLMKHLTAYGFATTLALSMAAVPALAGDLTLNAKGELSEGGKARVMQALKQTGHPPLAAPQAARTRPHTAPVMPRPATVTAASTAVAPVAMATPVTAQAPIVGDVPYPYTARTMRSPFMPPEAVRAPKVDTTNLPDLQRYPLGDFTLVGIIWTPNKRVAMVSTPDGKGYSVRTGSFIGTENGKVRRISRDAVTIEALRTDVFGESKKYETVLALRPEEAIP